MDEFDLYDTKPELIEEQSKNNISVTIFSLVIFVLAFLLLFGNEVNFIIYLIIVLLIHELGHFIMMKIFGYNNVRMLFIPLMGAFVQGKKDVYSQKQSFIVTLAGPFPGILLGAFLMWYANFVHSEWLVGLSLLFLTLNLINLLPLDPLDGGQLFKLYFRNSYELFLMIFSLFSSLFVIATGWFLNNYLIIIFGFFMGFRVRSLQKNYLMHKELRDQQVDFARNYKSLSNTDFHKIKEVLISHTPQLRKLIDVVPPDELDSIMASQVNNVLVTPLTLDAGIGFKLLLFVLWLFSFILPVLVYFTLDHNWMWSMIVFQE